MSSFNVKYKWSVQKNVFNNKKCSDQLLGMAKNFSMNENIRPLLKFSQTSRLGNDLIVRSNKWRSFPTFLALAAFAESGRIRLDIDLCHKLKVRHGFNYEFDILNKFSVQHTWFPLPNTMEYNRYFPRDKAQNYYVSQISHFFEHATIN